MEKKILLIKPPHRMLPLGMAYVCACLENHSIEFDFFDAEFGNHYKKMVEKNDYYAVATGGLLFQFKFFNAVSRLVREVNPDIPLILGGGITHDLRPDFIFDKLKFTYGIIGEAETSFPFLVDALRHKNTGLDTIPGLLYKDPATGEIRRNPVRRLDLTTTDILPAWHRFNVDYYLSTWDHGIFGHRSCMPVISARGCIGTCTFCSPIAGAFRKRPLEQVIREIEFLNERYAFDWIGFYNEMFYSTKEELINFCEAYKKIKPRKNWSCDLRVDVDFDIDTFRLMRSTGCVAVFGGLESGSNKILTLMNKRTTREMIIRFYRTAEDAGIPCIGGFLVGNEGETEIEIRETVDMVTSEKMRVLDAVVCPYPGTKIYRNALKKGLITDEWEYLQHLDFFPEIWDYTESKKNYLNISAIPNDRYLETITGELRRFHTFNLTHYVPKKISCSLKFGVLLKVSGICTTCAHPVSLVLPRRMLGIETFCRKCMQRVIFNLYELPEFNAHYRLLCTELQKTQRLAIAGTNIEAVNVLKYDYFQLNYRSLTAFIEIDEKASGISDFFYLPRIRIEGLPAIQPDTLLITDDPSGTVELKIRYFYLKKNMSPPRILHIMPDEKRPFTLFLKFTRQHAAPTIGNNVLVLTVIRIPLLVAELQLRLITAAKSLYHVLYGTALFQTFIKKVLQRR